MNQNFCRAGVTKREHLFPWALCLLAGLATTFFLQTVAGGPSTPITVTASGPGWGNTAFAAPQNGTFVAEIDATPFGTAVDAGVAIANGPQSAFAGLACIGRFNPTGTIDARDGGGYRSVSALPYTANATYHFRFVVNIPTHTYSLFVAPAGAAEQTIASNFNFRTEQAGVTTLNDWSVFADAGSMQACNFGAACATAAANSTWVNTPFGGSQSNIFERNGTPVPQFGALTPLWVCRMEGRPILRGSQRWRDSILRA